MKRFLTFCLLPFLLTSCSQFSRRPASVAFHNINAKYNAIWQAERIEKEILKGLRDSTKENYRNLLPIISLPDSIIANNYKDVIDKIIKKASIVIDRHQNSAYIDDAYFLIGKGRIYQSDWKNAIETFKYVNSIDPDNKSKISSLLNLYKIYIQTEEFQEADKVNEFLLTQNLDKSQSKEFYIANAWYHQKKKEPIKSIALLEESISLITNSKEKSRILYILGQMYFLQGNNDRALSYFKSVTKEKGNYDLSFQANLAIAQILDDEPALLKMLKEGKNEDLKPFIYVALGQIYYQKNEFEKAKEYWTLGAKNADQKGELYLQLGHLFAKQFRRPKEAIAYYDSAISYLSISHSEYPEIKKLTEKWKKFDQLVNGIQLNDSLLVLSSKSDEDLKKIYTKFQDSKNAKKDTTKAFTPSNLQTPIPQLLFTRRQSSPEQQSFYFYNDMVRIRGEQEFVSKWGVRNLEDFWNRKTKNNSSLSPNSSNSSVSTKIIDTKTTIAKDSVVSETPKDSLSIWLAKIPKTTKQQIEVQKSTEKLIFESGKFAKFELNDNDLTKEQLGSLLKRFPQTSYEAETLYLLYISEEINPKLRDSYKQSLFEKYPESHFKTLILKNETGSLSDNKELEAKKAYEKAFLIYKEGKYEQSFQNCLLIDHQFPGSSLEDKVLFLKALNKGGLKDLASYENLLSLFIQSFPKSPLKKEAEDLLKTYQSKKQ